MILKEVSLQNFRNVRRATVSFSDSVNFVCGENAQGKTSLLEAIYLLSCAKSFRTRKTRELIHYTETNALAEARFLTKTGEENRVRILLSKTQPKEVYRNGVRATRLSEIMGFFKTVLFTPEHLSMVKDGPGIRRAFLDGAISQLYPLYPSYLKEYERLYETRCSLLRQAKDNPAVMELFSLYHDKTAAISAKIAQKRREYAEELLPRASAQYERISDARERLHVSYVSDLGEARTEEELFIASKRILEQNLEMDLRNGFPVRGVHRDDLELSLDGHPARFFASQGQQRSIVLALKLAEGEICAELSGEIPVFLFDDVLSELDRRRRDFVLGKLEGKQTILSMCEPIRKKSLSGARRITVKNGEFS